ncbi:MAG: DegV family protein [Tissierellia bacterium]|nr:DegV family protein [Tissierellia bacterium]
MNNVKLFADSTCDLTAHDIKRMDVEIIPLVVTFAEEAYKEGIEITPKQLFNLVKEKKILPKTSAPSPIDFYNAFKPFVDAGKTIIYIGLSSKVSSTIQNAKLAASQFEENKVYVMDSLNLCVGSGALVKLAYNFINDFDTIDEVISNINNIIPNYKLYFTVDTLDYLHMGGRCSSTEALFGNMLNIKPIINMSVDGLKVWEKVRGKKKAINQMVQEIINDKDKIFLNEVHIGCTVGNEDERDLIKRQIIESTGITNIHEYTIGCVISSHCGEGTIGLGYYMKGC